MMKGLSRVCVEIVATAFNGLVTVGDRTAHAITAIVSNEFFLMVATIAAFVLLLKS